ncbi:MAG: tRNA lysidine(34) synthetase TilS [Myxococcota bacterium]
METQHTGNPDAVGPELGRSIERLGLADRRVLVAASGGLDSTVLAHALVASGACRGGVVLGHVHHGLRGAAADADQAAVAALAATLETTFHSRRISPESLREGRSSLDRPTLQEAARTLRYAAFHAMAAEAGARVVATAHHADDQAETVLLRLLRGTGPDGLAGIPERSSDGRVVRPLLRLPRADLEAYARSRGLAWREDASNASRRYARNRLRHDFLPALRDAFNPRLLRAIGDLAEAQSRDAEWIAARVNAELDRRVSVEGTWLRIDAKDWATLPAALSRRVARALLVRAGAGRHASRVHIERIDAFLRSARTGSRIELPGSLLLVRERGGFRLGAPAGGPPSAC